MLHVSAAPLKFVGQLLLFGIIVFYRMELAVSPFSATFLVWDNATNYAPITL